MKIKNVVLGFAGVIALVTGLSVSTAYGGQQAYTPNPNCVASHGIATDVMRLRQQGVERQVVESVLYSEMGLAISEMAFAKPIVNKEMKQTVVKAFAEYVFLVCENTLNPQAQDKVPGIAI